MLGAVLKVYPSEQGQELALGQQGARLMEWGLFSKGPPVWCMRHQVGLLVSENPTEQLLR